MTYASFFCVCFITLIEGEKSALVAVTNLKNKNYTIKVLSTSTEKPCGFHAVDELTFCVSLSY